VAVTECKKERNLETCPCTYEPCSRKGICCDCIAYHRALGELPGCYFSPEAERTYNRTIEYFVQLHSK